MSVRRTRKVWFSTAGQELAGPETIARGAAHSRQTAVDLARTWYGTDLGQLERAEGPLTHESCR